MYPNPQDALPLPSRPNLEQYRKLAKELLKAAKSPDHGSIHHWTSEWVQRLLKASGLVVTQHMPVETGHWVRQIEEFARHRLAQEPALTEAQFVIARASGFASWPKLVKHIQGQARAASDVARFEKAADAIVNGDLATLQRLLRQDPELVRMRSTREHSATLLHYISANGVEGYRQKTPKNAVQITSALLKAGAEVDAEADVYGGGATTLGLTATSCHPEAAGVQKDLMQLLLDHGAAIEHPGMAGNQHGAVSGCLANGRFAAAQFLAARGARLGLSEAAGLGRVDVLKSFFKPDGSLKSNATIEQMRNGFAWACQFGHTDVVDLLLQHGIQPDATQTHAGPSGLHWAAYAGHVAIVKRLLEHKAPVDIKEQRYGGIPLDWALHGWGESTRRQDYYQVVALLVAAGAKEEAQRLADPNRDMPLTAKIQADPKMLEALRGEMPPKS